jgi:hypothetical protein
VERSRQLARWIEARRDPPSPSTNSPATGYLVRPYAGAIPARLSMIAALATRDIAEASWNHIASARGSEDIGMETMKIHVLERALTAACVVAAIAVVWWGIKILSA